MGGENSPQFLQNVSVASSVVFTEGDDMVQQFSPERAAPSLADSVLPGTSDAGPRGLRTEGLDQPIDARRELRIVIVDQVPWCPIECEGVAQLLRDPSRTWCPRHVEMDDSPPGVINHDENV